MALAGPIIGAVGSLLGGIFGKSKGVSPSAQSYGHVQGLMNASKEFKISPLTLLNANVPGGHTAANNAPMGQAFADAAMFAADAFLKQGNQQALLVNQYQEQNRQLQERLTHVTLQPKVPGVYGGGDAGPRAASSGDGSGETGEAAAFPRDDVSRFGGDAIYGSPDDITGPQASVKQDVPAFRLFGHDFYGSGLFSTGQQVEDAIGEGPLQWAVSPALAYDAVGNEAFKWGERVGSERWKAKLKAKYERDRPDRVYDGIKSKPKPKKKKHDLHALGF